MALRLDDVQAPQPDACRQASQGPPSGVAGQHHAASPSAATQAIWMVDPLKASS
ncbi:hypothetical protein [Stenotrophomonas indicatrix]|uniref:hypothetical protein n=1 Tax=Stenotrophomonas indicatrix TaxID=2045451 RepID=UPI001877FCA9